MQRRGMTLWETLIVLTVLVIAAAILCPNFHLRAARRHRERAVCTSNLQKIALACAQYSQDFDGHLPLVSDGARGWADWLWPRTNSASVFQCPSEITSDGPFSTDYFFNARVAGLAKSQMPFPMQTIGFGDGPNDAPTDFHLTQLPLQWKNRDISPSSRHIGRANYLFIDGHVRVRSFREVSAQPPRRQGNSQATFAAR